MARGRDHHLSCTFLRNYNIREPDKGLFTKRSHGAGYLSWWKLSATRRMLKTGTLEREAIRRDSSYYDPSRAHSFSSSSKNYSRFFSSFFFSSLFRRRDKRTRFDRRARFVLGASHRDNSSFIARKVVDRAQYRVSSGVETTTEIDHADYRIITVIRLLERYVNSTFTGSPLPPTSE